jgi:hypothetical protein
MTNWTFYGWIDAFQSIEQHSKGTMIPQSISTYCMFLYLLTVIFVTFSCTDGIGQPSPKRPTAKILDVDDTASTLNICDDRNYVTVISVNKYFEFFPSNLEFKDGVVKATERERPGRNQELEQNLCGDAFWRSEISAIARKLDGDSGIVMVMMVVVMVIVMVVVVMMVVMVTMMMMVVMVTMMMMVVVMVTMMMMIVVMVMIMVPMVVVLMKMVMVIMMMKMVMMMMMVMVMMMMVMMVVVMVMIMVLMVVVLMKMVMVIMMMKMVMMMVMVMMMMVMVMMVVVMVMIMVVLLMKMVLVMVMIFLLLDKTTKKEIRQRLQTKETDLDNLCVETPWSIIISSPPWMKVFTVVDLYSSSDSFLLWLESNNTRETCDNHGVLCCWVEWRAEYLINV